MENRPTYKVPMMKPFKNIRNAIKRNSSVPAAVQNLSSASPYTTPDHSQKGVRATTSWLFHTAKPNRTDADKEEDKSSKGMSASMLALPPMSPSCSGSLAAIPSPAGLSPTRPLPRFDTTQANAEGDARSEAGKNKTPWPSAQTVLSSAFSPVMQNVHWPPSSPHKERSVQAALAAASQEPGIPTAKEVCDDLVAKIRGVEPSPVHELSVTRSALVSTDLAFSELCCISSEAVLTVCKERYNQVRISVLAADLV